MMGQTFTNVAASAPAGGGTSAKYTVSIGQMKFNETSGNSTAMGNFFQPIMAIFQPQPLLVVEVEPLSTSASTDLAI